MKKANVCAVLLMVVLLVGCGSDRYTFHDDGFTLTKTGRETTITDPQGTVVCALRTVRVRKPKTAEEAAERRRMTVAAETDTITVLCSGRVIIVYDKTDNEVFCFAGR